MPRFVENLRAIDYPEARYVFVIHEQTAAEVTFLATGVPEAAIIEPHRNLGTAAGWNLGLNMLLREGCDYIGMWNVDVRLDVDCLSQLVKVLESDPTIGACQPLLFYSDEPNKVQMYGGSLDARVGIAHHDYSGATDISKLPITHDADYLDGGTMLVRSKVLREVGLFDERLFMYCEDSDVSLRIRRAGYRTVAVRDACAWHYHRQDKGPFPPVYEEFYITRNRLFLARKHCSRNDWWNLVAQSLRASPRHALFWVRRRKAKLALAHLAGLAYGMAEVMGKRGRWVS